jgi:hypothetical protein
MNDLAGVCRELRIREIPEDWKATWAQSEVPFTRDEIAFLKAGPIQAACEDLGMTTEVQSALLEALSLVMKSEALRRVAVHCHWMLFRSGKPGKAGFWPLISREASPAGPFLYALVFLSGLPFITRIHQSRGIEWPVTRDTLSDLELWIVEHKRRYGTFGLREHGWLGKHFTGTLVKLGRLQYVVDHYGHPFRFYRQKADGRIVALAEDGQSFREDGQFTSADGGKGGGESWNSRLTIESGIIRGNPVRPEGAVDSHVVSLPCSEWDEILRQGDTTFSVHIPATGPMEHATCGESFRQAAAFCPRHFPEHANRAFTCDSWLLDPQFEFLLAPSSNVVRFLQEWYLHPVANASSRQTYERVFDIFDGSELDANRVPRGSLQRAIIDHVKNGKRCRNGGSVIFPADLDWGKQVYRTARTLI